ncbi:hypothetical protein PIB30_009317 [Stylosanthes scabra]|uniref:Uncharacterized protein n=1 Tax=Stylosanthes scabra TaxID=79078 RepID=A0ABU6T543_9FABA|nr:hypothetical protein [Stylosanthes scabra]
MWTLLQPAWVEADFLFHPSSNSLLIWKFTIPVKICLLLPLNSCELVRQIVSLSRDPDDAVRLISVALNYISRERLPAELKWNH